MKNECPACGAVYSVTTQHVGRRIACKKCGAALVVESDGIELAGRPRSADIPPTYQEGTAPPPSPQHQLPPFSPAIDNDDDPPPAYRSRMRGGTSPFVDYLLFRRMVTPVLIQVLFWVGVAAIVIMGIVSLVGAVAMIRDAPAVAIVMALTALGQIVVGPIFWRMTCEMILVAFRIYETLKEMKEKGIMIKDR